MMVGNTHLAVLVLAMVLAVVLDLGGILSVGKVVYYGMTGGGLADGHRHLANAVFYTRCGSDVRHRPVHHASQVPFDWAQMLRDNYHIILEELRAKDFPLVSISDFDAGNKYLNHHASWRALYLKIYGRETTVSKLMPKTMALLNKTPLLSVFISHISQGKALAFHRGSSQMMLRYHLGLEVPQGEPQPYLVVLDDRNGTGMDKDGKVYQGEWHEDHGKPPSNMYEARHGHIPPCWDNECIEEYHRQENSVGRVSQKLHWSDGDDLVFDDMFEHAVINENQDHRMILFADFIREDCPVALSWLMYAASYLWIPTFMQRTADIIEQANAFDYESYINGGFVDDEGGEGGGEEGVVDRHEEEEEGGVEHASDL
jgi:hypothetical protein